MTLDPTQQTAATAGMFLAAGGFMVHALVLAVLAYASATSQVRVKFDPYPVARPAGPADDSPPA